MDSLISITLWNVVLLGVLLALQPTIRVLGFGLTYALSNFDNRVDEGVFARRLAMVSRNQGEALALWVPVVLILAVMAPDLAHSHLSLIATAFLFARLAYTAVTFAGIPVLRSGTWIVGFAAWAYLTWITMAALA